MRRQRRHLELGRYAMGPGSKAEKYRSGELVGRQLLANVPEPSKHETMQGTITWDEGTEDGLPKLVTAEGKEYGWVELGKELVSCEGWRVKIEVG